MNIGFIGTGNMAGAMINGLVKNNYRPELIHIMNRTKEKAMKFKDDNINIYDTADEVIAKSDVIILGIKPNQYYDWLSEHELGNKLLISIGAGIQSEKLAKFVNRFIITMPNTPAVVNKGTTLLVESKELTEDILNIFQSFGSYQIVKEEELAKYMLVTGCAPAYYFSFVANLSKQLSTQFDLDKTVVEALLIDVLNGSAEMLNSELSAEQLTSNVCSPGGVTIQVVNELNEQLPNILKTGFTNAITRNDELTNA